MVVTAPDGTAAQYVYDPAGNILAINRFDAASLAVLGFSPAQGSVGDPVTVSGVGFSAVASENVIHLNGTVATAISSTSAQLTFLVPAGATSGPISVAVAGSSATSTDTFTVVAPVAISDINPNFGRAGTAVAISGQSFDSAPINDLVMFGQTRASVSAATATSIQTTVPAGVSTGPVKVQTLDGSAVSAANFVVVPSAVSTGSILSASDIAPGGSVAVGIDTSGKTRVFDFPGTARVGATLYVTGVTYPGSTSIQVFNPQGSGFSTSAVAAGATTKIDLGVLPMSGNYTIAVQPAAGSTGTLNLQVFIDSNAALPPDGAPVPLTAAVGQEISYTFAGNTGDSLSLAATNLSTTPAGGNVAFLIVRPDGSALATCNFASASSCIVPSLPQSGAYTVRANSTSGTGGFSTTVQLSRAVGGILTADGTPTVFTASRPGLASRYTFAATAGQNLTLQWLGSAAWPNQLTLTVLAPNGNSVYSDARQSPAWNSKADLLNLTAGTYTFVFQSTGVATGGSTTLILWPESTAPVVVDGATSSLTGVAGQNGRYTFSGAAGDGISLAATQVSTTPANTNLSFQLLSPTGGLMANCSFSAPGSCVWNALPVTGTYSIRVVPASAASFATTIQLSKAVSGALTADGTPTVFTSSRPGLTSRYTFVATAGQNLTLEWIGSAAWPNQLTLTVLNPSGNTVYSDARQSPAWDTKADLVNLTAGTYTFVFQSTGVLTGNSSTLILWPESTAAVAVDGAASAMTGATGQNGRYTFSGTAGDVISFAATQVSTTPANINLSFQLLSPTNGLMANCPLSAPGSCVWNTLPITGTYSIRVAPASAASFATTVQLSKAVSGALTADGTPTVFTSSRPGLTSRYTFVATAGQNLTFEWIGSAAWPNPLALTVLNPNGNSVYVDGRQTQAWDTKVDLLNLTAGTYTFVFQSTGVATGNSSTLILWPESTATVAVDGAASAMTGATGQNGRYTFSGTAGDVISFGATQVSTTPANVNLSLQLLSPTNGLMANCPLSAPGSCVWNALPITGTYSIRVVPASAASFATTIQLSKAVSGVLTADGTPTVFTSSRPGLTSRYLLAATAGQHLTIDWSGAAWPNQLLLTILAPNGNTVYQGAKQSPAWDSNIDLPNLTAGNYSFVFQSTGVATGNNSSLSAAAF